MSIYANIDDAKVIALVDRIHRIRGEAISLALMADTIYDRHMLGSRTMTNECLESFKHEMIAARDAIQTQIDEMNLNITAPQYDGT